MTVRECYELFLADREQNCSPKTVGYYKGRLKKFLDRFGDREFASIEALEIHQLFLLIGKTLSGTTRRHNIVAFETMQKWAVKLKLLKAPVVEPMDKPPMGHRTQLPTPEQTEKLLAAGSPAFCRIYTALRLSAARPGEMCRATVADWDRDAGLIILAEHKTAKKTGKPRKIPINEDLKALILESLGDRTEGPLFLTEQGRPWKSEYLSSTYGRTRKKAGLPKGLVLYLARHEAGTALAEEGDLHMTMLIMGHSDTKTTQRYVHRKDAEMVCASNALRKLSNLHPDLQKPVEEPKKAA